MSDKDIDQAPAEDVAVEDPKPVEEDATEATPAIQVSGLRDTFVFVAVLITSGLAIGLWGWFRQFGLRLAKPGRAEGNDR